MESLPPAQEVNVIIVEDESLYRDMLRRALDQDPRVHVVGTFAEPYSVLKNPAVARAGVALLDIDLNSDLNGFELGLRLRRTYPRIGLVFLSNFAEEAFIATLRRQKMSGWAYLLKKSVRDVPTLSRVIQGVTQGMIAIDPELANTLQPRKKTKLDELTPRQRDILKLLAQGYSNQAIAEELGIAVKSVENHMNDMLSRLEVDSSDRRIHPRVAAVLCYLYETRFP